MEFQFADILGGIGVVLIVLAFLLLELDRVTSKSIVYLLMNAVGALLVILSLWYEFNLAAFVLEVFWLLISLFGLVRVLGQNSRKKTSQDNHQRSARLTE